MFDIVEFIARIFKGESKNSSGNKARERLKLVLVSDRASISPHLMESLREELIEVISRYMKIDTKSMEMGLERKNGHMALAANIPIIDVTRSRKGTGGKSDLARRTASVVRQDRPAREEMPGEKEDHPCDSGEYNTESVEIDTGSIELTTEEIRTGKISKRRGKKSRKRYLARAQGRSLRKRSKV